MFYDQLKNYARLLVRKGINIQEGQDLVISATVDMKDLVRLCSQVAYQEGAHEVHVIWSDDQLSQMKYLYAGEDVFSKLPSHVADELTYYQKRGAGFLSLVGSDPELLMNVESKRIKDYTLSRSKALKKFNNALMKNKNTWLVAAYPTPAWAQAVYPQDPQAVEKLWEAIFKACRIDDQAEANWDRHVAQLAEKAAFLNQAQFTKLHYKNSLGTDLTLELPKNHIWAGGADLSQDQVPFIANIPTEEIFTAPKKTGTQGRVYSSMPLNYAGNLIEDFYLDFKDGKVVQAQAKKGQVYLDQLLATDQDAAYLGEVALVPYDSPISNQRLLFFETLFDENASCHLALGQAYPSSIENGESLSQDQLLERGLNDSLIHVDFMVGTGDLSIVGEKENGEKVQIFKEGNWA
ncbi:MAG: aminopeptidase [Tissierellia bacterium]|nr:aminopeptidase [Tissierellia bacterium]